MMICAVLTLGCLLWVVYAAVAFYNMKTTRTLSRENAPPPPSFPRVSLIIPARNEAATIESALASKLRDDYPGLEIIAVDDRSTDDTGKILDRMAAQDARLKVLHLTELPDGWLGKVHALHRGTQASSGDWLLFSDADVHFEQHTIRRAISLCENERLDFLTIIPEFRPAGFFVDIAISTFIRMIACGVRSRAVENPASSMALGSGSFNLARRSVYEKSAGFEWLKMEVTDDIGFGFLMKRSGARCAVASGTDTVAVTFYHNLAELFRGAEKNGFSGIGSFSIPRLIILGLLFLLVELSPVLALIFADTWYWLAGAIVGVTASWTTTIAANIWNKRSWITALLWPFGSVIFASTLFYSGWYGWRRGGLRWRDSFYPTELLKKGQKIKFYLTGIKEVV